MKDTAKTSDIDTLRNNNDSLTNTQLVDSNNESGNSNFSEGLSIEIIGGIISGIILLIILFYWGKIRSFFKKKDLPVSETYKFKSFDGLVMRNSVEEMKKNLKIILIDDHDIFPVKGFKEFGYNIDHWVKLDYPKLRQLREGEFDIVILDIYDVAKDIAEKDGLDILEDVKSNNPAQIVIAYSGHSFDMSKNKFWELADEKLGKPTPFVGTQKIIDSLIEKVFTINYFHTKLREQIGNHIDAINSFAAIEKAFVESKKNGTLPNWTEVIKPLSIPEKDKTKVVEILKKFWKYTMVK